MKCDKCGGDKSRVPDASKPSGFRMRCRPCQRERQREWDRARTTERRRDYRLGVYGINNDEYQRLIAAQGGLCACCGKRPAKDIDHDHNTGAIRGVLCFHCNVGIGHLGDGVDGVRAALAYLTRG